MLKADYKGKPVRIPDERTNDFHPLSLCLSYVLYIGTESSFEGRRQI